mgnify:CR=1 FL=1
MKRITGWLLCAALSISFAHTSCVKDDTGIDANENTPRKIALTGDIEQVYTTRVSDAGFCDGDAVGIYIVDYSNSTAGALLDAGNRADNVKHTFNEAAYTWIPTQDIYWKDDKTHIDIYGYYPYSTPDNVQNYAFEVQKDQSTSAAYGKIGGYEASDFLWGKAEHVAPTDKVIKLGFRHKMASARVTLAEGTGFKEGEWAAAEKAVLVLNTKRKALIDLSTGIVTATGDMPSTGTIPYKNGGDYRAIIVPQEVAASTPLLSITVGGTPYLLKKDEGFTYIPSKQHNFTVTVNKREGSGYEFVLTSESITAWENDSASHDATAREYIVIDVATAGGLKDAIKAAGKEHAKVKNLKVTGTINATDFYFMRDEMAVLQALNLKEVEIAAAGDDQWGNPMVANVIPYEAMRGKSSLMRLTLPDKLVKIENSAFYACHNLVGSLIIPEEVIEIGDTSFGGCKSMTGVLSLPSALKTIGAAAFQDCGFSCNLVLPAQLLELKANAFSCCFNLYGELHIPEKLTKIEAATFQCCIGLSGSIEIPEGVTEIGDYAFGFTGMSGYYNGNFYGTLTLPNSLISIGKGAFMGTGLRGELNLPKELVIIPDQAFLRCDFSGELKIPETTAVIGAEAFKDNWRLMGVLNIPQDVQSIGANAFESCRGIEGVIFTDGIETIGRYAFNMCTGIGSIICKGITPAYVISGAFDGVPKDNFTVEVPESAIQQYQTAVGWSDFKRISAYRNLVIRPNVATAINTSVTRDLVLTADDEWIVESQPDWVTLDKTSGKGKVELKMTFSEMTKGSAKREGEVVFKLKEKEYRTRCAVTQYNYEYAEDHILTLQTKSKGKGVNLVFLGDGYNAKDISEGNYLKDINEAVEHYFNIEPFKTYRGYFNVYTGIAVSPESGVGGVNTIIYNRFNTSAKGGVNLGGRNGESDYNEIFKYACKAPTVNESNLGETLIVMIPNTKDYGGICYMYDDGSAIAYCPMSDYGYPLDFRGVIQHEAGGHGFGKLGDEYIYHNAFIDNCPCTCCGHVFEFNLAKAKGWYPNLSLTGKMNEVPWSHLIFHEKYNQIVDVFEGAFMHTRGVYRSEQNSCMNNDIPYYSTISREAIVKRIKTIAGETYNFNDFVANDVMDASTVNATRSSVPDFVSKAAMHQQAPVMMGKRPKLNN